jgi:hypothetical protein
LKVREGGRRASLPFHRLAEQGHHHLSSRHLKVREQSRATTTSRASESSVTLLKVRERAGGELRRAAVGEGRKEGRKEGMALPFLPDGTCLLGCVAV